MNTEHAVAGSTRRSVRQFGWLAEDLEWRYGERIATVDDVPARRAVEEAFNLEPPFCDLISQKTAHLVDRIAASELALAAILDYGIHAEACGAS